MGEEVALNVEELGAGEDRSDLGLAQVVRGELLSGSKGGDKRSVVSRDDDGASTGLNWRRLNLVGGNNTLGLVGSLERLHEIVVSDRTEVGHRFAGEDVLAKYQSRVAEGSTVQLTEAARAAFWAAPPATYVTSQFFTTSS